MRIFFAQFSKKIFTGGECKILTSRMEAGVSGEVVGMGMSNSVKNESIQKETAVQLSGLAGSATSLFAGVATGLEDEDIAKNMFAGQNIGSNVARDNALYVGGKVKIPGSDLLTGKGNDYDLHSGLNIGKGLEQKSIGTDGKGSAFYVIPEFALGGYINLLPHNENVDKTFSVGYKNFISADYLTTHQGNNGYGISLGVSTSLLNWVPGNITVDNSK